MEHYINGGSKGPYNGDPKMNNPDIDVNPVNDNDPIKLPTQISNHPQTYRPPGYGPGGSDSPEGIAPWERIYKLAPMHLGSAGPANRFIFKSAEWKYQKH